MTHGDWRDDYRAEGHRASTVAWWTLGRVIRFVVLPLFVFFGVLYALGVFGTVASAPGRVISRTLETDNILYNYEWFKRQHEQIGAVGMQAEDAKAALDAYKQDAGPRTSWDYQTTAEYNRLQAVALGLQNQRRNYVAEYNARAKMANRNIFMGRGLPAQEE